MNFFKTLPSIFHSSCFPLTNLEFWSNLLPKGFLIKSLVSKLVPPSLILDLWMTQVERLNIFLMPLNWIPSNDQKLTLRKQAIIASTEFMLYLSWLSSQKGILSRIIKSWSRWKLSISTKQYIVLFGAHLSPTTMERNLLSIAYLRLYLL